MEAKQYNIYLIASPEHWYVGSAFGKQSSPSRRFEKHASGKGRAPALWEAIQEFGVDYFSQSILETGFGDPIVAEARWYDHHQATDPRKCLNMKRPDGWDGASRMLGKERSTETRQKISAALTGHQHSEETKAKIGATSTGRIPSLETRQKISSALTGRVRTPEHCAQISASKKGRIPNHPVVECECGLTTTAGALGMHLKATGHVKR